MPPEISQYNEAQQPELKAVCELLAEQIDNALPDADSKIWHAHKDNLQMLPYEKVVR